MTKTRLYLTPLILWLTLGLASSLNAEVISVQSQQIAIQLIDSSINLNIRLKEFVDNSYYRADLEVPDKRFLPTSKQRIKIELSTIDSIKVFAEVEACEKLNCRVRVFYPYRGLKGQRAQANWPWHPKFLPLVPLSSVISPEGKETVLRQLHSGEMFVFVRNGDVVEKRKIVIWNDSPILGLVLSGLESGDQIVTAGFERLIDGQKVRLVR